MKITQSMFLKIVYLSLTGSMRTCNGTEAESMAAIDVHVYHIINLSALCVICVGNILLSIPLLVVISRSPCLLSKPRFCFLFHLLCCDNLQLLVLLAQATFLTIRFAMPVVQCWVLMGTSQFLVMVAMLLHAALSVDRCIAIKVPLR